MTFWVAGDYLTFPGVRQVWVAYPDPGCVTLIVEPEARGIAGYLDPGEGDGTGLVPIGTRVYTIVEGGPA